MKERYLWDRSGEADPVIESLEQSLQKLRPSQPLRLPPARTWPSREDIRHALAACVLLAIAASLFIPSKPGIPAVEETPWQITSVNGPFSLNGPAPGPSTAPFNAKLYSNQTLRTGTGSHVRLEADEVGRIDLEPGTVLRLAKSAPLRQTLRLTQGTIHVLIWAPPRQFIVETSSSRAIDLGCEYGLSVQPSGDGLLQVEFGWVAFQFQGREAFIPAGARCRTSIRSGPATPYYADSIPQFQDAVEAYDRSKSGPCRDAAHGCGDREALGRILLNAAPKDAMTLWHLLARARSSERPAVFDRFVQLAGNPPGVTREGILTGDPTMLDRCWNALNLMDVEFWRGWQRDWNAPPNQDHPSAR